MKPLSSITIVPPQLLPFTFVCRECALLKSRSAAVRTPRSVWALYAPARASRAPGPASTAHRALHVINRTFINKPYLPRSSRRVDTVAKKISIIYIVDQATDHADLHSRQRVVHGREGLLACNPMIRCRAQLMLQPPKQMLDWVVPISCVSRDSGRCWDPVGSDK